MRGIPAFFILALLLATTLFAQTPQPPRERSGMLEQERTKAALKSSMTTVATFKERADFAQAWISQLAAAGHAEKVQRIAPLGTILKIRQAAVLTPESACKDLDDLFRKLEMIEISPTGSNAPAAEERTASREVHVRNSVSKARLWAKVYFPRRPAISAKLPVIIYITGGLGCGSEPGVQRMAQTIAENGFVVGIFDPDGRGKSEGREDWNGKIQQEGLRAFVKAVTELDIVDPHNMGMVSISYGVALAAGCLGRHADELGIRYLIDVEGPSDRFAISLNNSPVLLADFDNHRTADIEWWREREAVRWITRIGVRYLRLQCERDHLQPGNDHAIALINAATNERYGGSGRSSWTRVNGPENRPNRTYTMEDPPAWLPGKGLVGPDVILRSIKEMAGKDDSAALPGR